MWHLFTRQDWEAFADAERFKDGSAPLAADVRVDGINVYAIADGGALTLVCSGDEYDVLWVLHTQASRVIAELLPLELTSRWLEEMGWHKQSQ